MKYANWCTESEMKDVLLKVDVKGEVQRAGVPIMHDNKYLYVNDKDAHTLVIGSSGSGKTQATILPTIKLAMKAGESIFLNDVKGEIYSKMAGLFEKNGYNVIAINIDNPNFGNAWNPLTLPYKLYKDGNKDKALELVQNIGYYLFNDTKEKTLDPFWINTSTDYFTGITLYLFENTKEEEINMRSIYDTALNASDDAKNFLDSVKKYSNIYFNLLGTLNSPVETRAGIIATLSEKMKDYVCRDNLSDMMASTDFDISNVGNEKVAIFAISGNTSYSSNLIPLLVNQLIDSVDIYGKREKKFNMVLDEFDTMLPIKNFARIINYAKGLKIRFIVAIKGYLDLINVYGKEDYEIVKACFENIIYLLSNDIYTLEEISNICGKTLTNKNELIPLISPEELMTLKNFEAIVKIPRVMPFRTNLLPDYEIDWNMDEVFKEMPERKSK